VARYHLLDAVANEECTANCESRICMKARLVPRHVMSVSVWYSSNERSLNQETLSWRGFELYACNWLCEAQAVRDHAKAIRCLTSGRRLRTPFLTRNLAGLGIDVFFFADTAKCSVCFNLSIKCFNTDSLLLAFEWTVFASVVDLRWVLMSFHYISAFCVEHDIILDERVRTSIQ
jgi:hypothetical protein